MAEEYSAKPEGHDPREASSNNCIVMLGHFPRSDIKSENDPSSEPVELCKPLCTWRTPNAHLHIDDGSMGGGGPIPHENKIGLSKGDINVYDDYYLNSAYFNPSRNGIFHYCIIGHELYTGESGIGATGGAPIFVIAGAKVSNMAHTFMHELGHNLMGYLHDEDIDGNSDGNPDGPPDPPTVPYNGNNKDATHLILTQKDRDQGRYRWSHCSHDCIMKKSSSYMNFCDDCIDDMKFDLCL